jgi:nitrogen regulatory protein PII
MSLATHTKKRVEIFVEAPALHQVLEALDGAGVQGYTVLQAIAGRGHTGGWQIDDSFNDASHMVAVICILDGGLVDAVVDAVFGIVKRQIGVMSISDVLVVRPEHF